MFAPVYRPRRHQQSFWSRRDRLESRKRKRDEILDQENESQASPEPDPTPRSRTTAVHPVNRTDPYHIAGHPREEPLPPLPFPYAAAKENKPAPRPIDEELAELNPPLYVKPVAAQEKTTSLKRRHLDNITTILHRCMLKGDWKRAYDAWCLLVRSEIGGGGVDPRRNGRWGIGAELLMRKDVSVAPHDSGTRNVDALREDTPEGEALNSFAFEGFKKARDYYERFIVQYPYTRDQTDGFNATVIYPALFSLWIYEVQYHSKRAQRGLEPVRSDSVDNDIEGTSPEVSLIRLNELEQALPIADRMDELLLNPLYDSEQELKRLRGDVARWLVDLYEDAGGEWQHGQHSTRMILEREKGVITQQGE